MALNKTLVHFPLSHLLVFEPIVYIKISLSARALTNDIKARFFVVFFFFFFCFFCLFFFKEIQVTVIYSRTILVAVTV